jgi:hypothetical protein
MKKLACFLMMLCLAIGCASASKIAPAVKPAAPYGEKTEPDSAVLIFPEAIVMYSKNLSYNNRVSRNCEPQFQTTLTFIDQDLSRFENTMTLKCPEPNTAGAELRAFIVSVPTDNLPSLPTKFVTTVEVGEPIKMMTATHFTLTSLAGLLESLARYEFAPYVCPDKTKIVSDHKSVPDDGMIQLLADRLTIRRLADGSRYLKYDEVVAAWETARHFAEFRAGCLSSDVDVDEMFDQLRILLGHLYGSETP